MSKRKTNPILIIVLCALCLVLVTVIVALICGLRYVSCHGSKFIGKVDDGQPYHSYFMKDAEGTSVSLTTKDGTAKLEYENGDVYVGEIEGLCRDGQGTLTCNVRFVEDKKIYDVYEGGWKDGKPHGRGMYTYDVTENKETGEVISRGDRYEGDVVNGKWEGKGKYVWANGDCYTGDFKAGLADGVGEYQWTNGNLYSGSFSKGARHGQGTFTMSSGEVYEGNWVDDRRDTLGKDGLLRYSNGDQYQGAFIANLPDTRQRDENGEFILDEDGNFVHGAKAMYTYSSGRFYPGYFEAGKIVVTDDSPVPDVDESSIVPPEESSAAE